MVSDKKYKFGNIVFHIKSPQELKDNEQLEDFVIENSLHADYIYSIYPMEIKTDSRIISPVYIKKFKNFIEVYIQESLISRITVANLLSVTNAATYLPEKDEFVLHTAFVLYNGKAILFCAPSGIGKSTQANYWREVKNAEVVNEDRAVIFKRDNVYYAGGCWATGKSRICLNRTAPIQKIILLEQGKENHRIDLPLAEKFKRLIEQCSFDAGSEKSRNKIISLVLDLISAVSVIGYACIDDVSSVEELEKYI